MFTVVYKFTMVLGGLTEAHGAVLQPILKPEVVKFVDCHRIYRDNARTISFHENYNKISRKSGRPKLSSLFIID